MTEQVINIHGRKIRYISRNTIVVGSGAAGLNAAVSLWKNGQRDIAIVTEGLELGTSRNTGSDKQTYYKLTTAGEMGDSVRKMAETLFSGGAMDGDIALAEAAGSAAGFFHMADIGVPFPRNEYGEYVGYKTDHDPVTRGTSAGPLTSKFMTECLISEAAEKKIDIFDGYIVIELLTFEANGEKCTAGVLTIDKAALKENRVSYVVFGAKNVVYAVGGEAGMYKDSVYPPQQIGGMGPLLRAGAAAKNLTESQYGIASVKFRWNLSGTFQQVLPRYISVDDDGQDEREFLRDYFPDDNAVINACFLKGYQWPFDPRKALEYGSSLVDILVYYETQVLGRKVYLDYVHNPSGLKLTEGKLCIDALPKEVGEYLRNSGADQALPIDRLEHMNPAAVKLYKDHGIDLYTDKLEISVCAQHNNGGIAGNMWWQGSICGLFPVGEVNGSHGVYRPGGSALNSGQVGSARAAQYIAHKRSGDAMTADELAKLCGAQIAAAAEFGSRALASSEKTDIAAQWRTLQARMSKAGAFIREEKMVEAALTAAKAQLKHLEDEAGAGSAAQLAMLYRVRDLAFSQTVYLSAILDYIRQGGESRGSYMILRSYGERISDKLPESFRFALDGGKWDDKIQEVRIVSGKCECSWRQVRPLPEADIWFENVWRDYREEKIYDVNQLIAKRK